MTPEGQAVEIDLTAPEKTEQEFARAMSEPSGDDKAPPKRAERKPAAPKAQEKPRVSRGPGRPAGSKSEAPKGLSKEARSQGVAGIVQLAAGGCLLAERGTGQKAFKADAITLASSAGEIGEAIADVCDSDERFARVIDKVCAAGPYSALITVMFSVGSQIARNHGAAVPGTSNPEDLIAMAEQPVAA
jgi:hypothetical protein